MKQYLENPTTRGLAERVLNDLLRLEDMTHYEFGEITSMIDLLQDSLYGDNKRRLTDVEILGIAFSMAEIWNWDTEYTIIPSVGSHLIFVKHGIDPYKTTLKYTPQEFIKEWKDSIITDYYNYEYHYVSEEQLKIIEENY